ncbi:LysR substrate-binding domain-containing protein [Tropicimonas sp. IMCC34011]|uniref:LysR substrate-binding domain-containing protein n=1 Tax=Tropicimonas sp. IMCC34011 TaxID=2248759 RepID=UPI000E246560|nr:LysR substrate-binding domain-containing protein [Tropicimonas sp. IMCC34011]
MARALNLRQVEVFKAVMEIGTVSGAAELLNVSQPAASKLLMQLEGDNGLSLFDRRKGRLIPTTQGLYLYEEVERIFAGVKQVESAIDYIKREDRARLIIGVPPGLAGSFMRCVVKRFLDRCPNVYCQIQSRRSRWLVEHVGTRQIDIAVSPTPIENGSFVVDHFAALPLVCIMPQGHRLADRDVIRPEDLATEQFIAFDLDSHTGQKVDSLFREHGVHANVVVTTDSVNSVTELVAGGIGVSLVYPLFCNAMDTRIVSRPFRPSVALDQYLMHASDARNLPLIRTFCEEVRHECARILGTASD